ncbi:MAG: hypothetical protein AAB368_02615 [bacterium]
MTLDGDKEMKARLSAGALEFPTEVRAALREYVKEKGEIARQRAPLGPTGNLRASGKTRVALGGKKGNLSVSMVFGGASAPYANVVAWGRDGKGGNPFMQDTLMEAVPTAAPEIAEKIELKKVFK